MTTPLENLHYLLMADHFIFQKLLFGAIRDTGLTLGQPKILDYLKSHNGAFQKEIAAACHIEQASLTSVLGGMEKKGLITRENRDGNRRTLYVYLTVNGRELADRIDSEFLRIETGALEGFEDNEKALLSEYLQRVHKNISDSQM